jgi:hypothetical protein
MQIFEYLNQLRAFERRHFPFVRTIEDLDIINLIGLHQERGVVLTLKQILSFNIGSVATLERRLARLKRLGVVVQTRSHIDKRNVELKLSPKVNRLYQRYSGLVQSSHFAFGGEQAGE